jgi:DNA-binding NtrC family response regulator
LAHHFLAKYATEMNKKILGISNQAMRAMLNHDWPGNVRELENVIERAVIFAENGEIAEGDLPFQAAEPAPDTGEALKEALAQFERQHIIYSLRRHRFDKTETAKNLGIGVSSLYRKLDELNIPKDFEDREVSPGMTRDGP